jgi:hypothetical protein
VLNFEAISEEITLNSAAVEAVGAIALVDDQIQTVAHNYELQMQAYALALRELLPAGVRIHSLRATLHFIDPNVESRLTPELLEQRACADSIDAAMDTIASLDGTLDAAAFPPLPASHCRMCNYLELCPAGKEWLRTRTQARGRSESGL